ncbi:cytochrome P450 family protein [Ceratobasidium sp. AG-Ba]|nr:cytochrome P450 family protein [Ceratobasidium sp. AG-Ba]
MIILNSSEAAIELLEHRSSAYSHRPQLVMANELVGWKNAIPNMNYGDTFKRARKLLYEGLSPKAVRPFIPLQQQETVRFVQRLLESPGHIVQHIRQSAGSSVIKLTYGYDIKGQNDYFLNLAEETINMFSIVTTPGMFLVDVLPWLRYLPWAPFKVKAQRWRRLLSEFREKPMEYTRNKMATGHFEPCLASRWLERLDNKDNAERQEYESIIKWAGVALYGGGADTVYCFGYFNFLYLYERLPTYDDRESLPYLGALYKEVLRWHPVGPLAVPHCLDSEKDDVYRGMFIPRGCVVVPNVGAMLSNPEVYHDPEVFRPERFLGHDGRLPEPDPERFIFGFGKRFGRSIFRDHYGAVQALK